MVRGKQVNGGPLVAAGKVAARTVGVGKVAAPLIAAALAGPAAAAPLPAQDDRVHEGVASCASTVCHGRVNRAQDSTVWLNEYRVWLRQDYHSRAYRTLLTDQSKDMAEKLGLAAAHTADLCLDCHADNVPPAQRGARFQIDDGVGCEACHGGAEAWLESHAEAGTSHTDNIARGLYPTEDPATKAALCLSCHLGTRDKFATHRIMGAGHPRLSFELETFTVNQPAHFTVDADYRERKRDRDPVASWLTGLAASSAQLLELLAGGAYRGDGLFPELAFYQCHACHHGMEQLRWQPDPAFPSLEPGSVRLNDGPLLVLLSALAVVDSAAQAELRAALAGLHGVSPGQASALATRAEALATRLDTVATALASASFPAAQLGSIRRQLLADSAAGRFRYYTAAEQAFLAIETLSLEIGDNDVREGALDALFDALGSETDYAPERFALRARQFLEGL